MNSGLERLQPYPFQQLSALYSDLAPPADSAPVALSIGEPKHAAPAFVTEVLNANLSGLSQYPPTRGSAALREAIAAWAARRYGCRLDPERQVLPVNGTREALFAFAQCVIDSRSDALVAMPNPFYQIYEGATLLAGATPYFLNCTAATGFLPDFDAVPAAVWQRCQLLYICTPGNPSGCTLSRQQLVQLIELAERYDFILASDECYSEIYPPQASPPEGLLAACAHSGRHDFKRCVVFNSLSKRSNLPGLRSGFVAGDAELLGQFLRYRTYHGGAMSLTVQAVSAAVWQDEAHVAENRAQYHSKFTAVLPELPTELAVELPPAGFFLWARTPNGLSDTAFARALFAGHNVTVLPGRFLARAQHGVNPGEGYVRLALVASLAECVTAAQRIKRCLTNLTY